MSKKDKNILGKSSTTLIKARISVLEKHFRKSGNQLGLDAQLGNTTVDGWTDKRIGKPTLAVKEFLKHYHIRLEWWKTGEGDVFLQKGTDEPSVETLKEKESPYIPGERETFIENTARMGKIIDHLLKEIENLRGGA